MLKSIALGLGLLIGCQTAAHAERMVTQYEHEMVRTYSSNGACYSAIMNQLVHMQEINHGFQPQYVMQPAASSGTVYWNDNMNTIFKSVDCKGGTMYQSGSYMTHY